MSLDKINKKLKSYYATTDKMLEKTIKQNSNVIKVEYERALKSIKSQMAEMIEKYPTYDEMVAYKRLEKLEKSISETIKQLSKESKKNMRGFLTQGVLDGYNTGAYAMESASGVSFSIMNDRVVALNKLNNYQKITWLDATNDNELITIKRMNSAISQGLIEGESYQQIASRMTDQMGKAYYRMDRTARTEIHKSQMFGRQLGFEEANKTDLKVVKKWLSASDGRVRPNHLAMNNKTAIYGENNDKFSFTTDKGNVMLVDAPGLTGTTSNINCRCSSITEFLDIEENTNYKVKSYNNFVDSKTK